MTPPHLPRFHIAGTIPAYWQAEEVATVNGAIIRGMTCNQSHPELSILPSDAFSSWTRRRDVLMSVTGPCLVSYSVKFGNTYVVWEGISLSPTLTRSFRICIALPPTRKRGTWDGKWEHPRLFGPISWMQPPSKCTPAHFDISIPSLFGAHSGHITLLGESAEESDDLKCKKRGEGDLLLGFLPHCSMSFQQQAQVACLN